MRPKIESKFGFPEIKALKQLFIDKGWDKFEEFETFFQNYCSLLENLNKDQSNLVIDLTKEFIWLRDVDYLTSLKSTLHKILDFPHLNLETIHIVPLKAPSDYGKTKSSGYVAYLCKNSALRYDPLLSKSNFKIYDSLIKLPCPKTLKRSKNPVILIDDFIGTGDTALEALDELLKIKDYDNQILFIASLICQREGKSAIEKKGYHLLSPMVRGKGISDFYPSLKVKEMKVLMDEIESILEEDEKFNLKYKFGYKESEALVSLIRSPNNTFPIYWFSAKSGKAKKWMAPFPR